MKLLEKKLTEIISLESSRTFDDKRNKEFEQLLAEMKRTGLIKQSNYNLPLVDTIGKTYYSSINKH